MDAEFPEHRAEMIPDGVGAEVHLGGDGPYPLTAGETKNDLPLAVRKLVHSGNPQDVIGGGRSPFDAPALYLGSDPSPMGLHVRGAGAGSVGGGFSFVRGGQWHAP